jgi:hypothetical protein
MPTAGELFMISGAAMFALGAWLLWFALRQPRRRAAAPRRPALHPTRYSGVPQPYPTTVDPLTAATLAMHRPRPAPPTAVMPRVRIAPSPHGRNHNR